MFVKLNYCKNVFIILLSILLFPTVVKSSQNDVERYGRVEGKPIDGGFFFYDNEYIEAPYVVERRGLDIYVNGLKVGFVPEPYDWRVMEDPGPPPEGSKLPASIPWPGTEYYDKYWGYKYRYIRASKGEKEANLEFLNILRNMPGIDHIEMDSGNSQAIIYRSNGPKQIFNLSSDFIEGDPFPPVPSKDDLIKMTEENREYFENKFRRNQGFFDRSNGGCMSMGANRVLDMVDILISMETPEDRAGAISTSFGKKLLTEPWISQLNGIKSKTQLIERAKKIRKQIELEKQIKEAITIGESSLDWIAQPENLPDIDNNTPSLGNQGSGNNADHNSVTEAGDTTVKNNLVKKALMSDSKSLESSGTRTVWLVAMIGISIAISVFLVLRIWQYARRK